LGDATTRAIGETRTGWGMILAVPTVMRTLEARFHPQRKDGGDFIVVGHVVWEGESARPVVQPSTEVLIRHEQATLLSKVQYLVSISARESFERLQALRSQFWTFVEVH
jgi:hypothetical protein